MKQFQCSACITPSLKTIDFFVSKYLFIKNKFCLKNNLKLLADFFLVLEANDDSLPSISERIACHDKSQKN